MLVVVGYDTLSYPLLFSWKLVCLSTWLVLPLASQLLYPSFAPILVPMCWLVTMVPSKYCLPLLVCTDPVGAASSIEYNSEDPSGGYFVEFDDAADE